MKHFSIPGENLIHRGLRDKVTQEFLTARAAIDPKALLKARNAQALDEREQAFDRLETLFGFDFRFLKSSKQDSRVVMFAVPAEDTLIGFRLRNRFDTEDVVSNHIVFEVLRGSGMSSHQRMVLVPKTEGWLVATMDDKQSKKLSGCQYEPVSDTDLVAHFQSWGREVMPQPLQNAFIREAKKAWQTKADLRKSRARFRHFIAS